MQHTKLVPYFFTEIFIFEVILHSYSVARNNIERSHESFTWFLSVVTFYKTIVQYYNQDIDNHRYSQDTEQCCHLKDLSCWSHPPSSPTNPKALATTNLFFISNFFNIKMLHQWTHIVYHCFGIVCFAQHSSFEMYPSCCMYSVACSYLLLNSIPYMDITSVFFH